MKKQLWQYLRMIENRLDMIPMRAGLIVTVECPNPWTPDLWIDFLNADPEKPRSLWPVYKNFARAMEDLRDAIDEAGIQYNDEIRNMKLLSKVGFLTNYESLRGDAERLHHGIKGAVVGNEGDMVKALGKMTVPGQRDSEAQRLILGGAKIPPWITTVRITSLMAVDDTEIHLTVPGAGGDNFWLSNVVSGLVSSYAAGKVGRLCAARDCERFFIPSARRRDQKYHSTRCQNRTFMRRARMEV